MKMILNKCYGGLRYPFEALEKFPEADDDRDEYRTNPEIIEMLETENYDKEVFNKIYYYSRPVVVEIPDEATDYRMIEYDGIEEIIYVLDGKLYSC